MRIYEVTYIHSVLDSMNNESECEQIAKIELDDFGLLTDEEMYCSAVYKAFAQRQPNEDVVKIELICW